MRHRNQNSAPSHGREHPYATLRHAEDMNNQSCLLASTIAWSREQMDEYEQGGACWSHGHNRTAVLDGRFPDLKQVSLPTPEHTSIRA
jgi:hypothetical protein